jgi:hypothetical protein
VAKYGEAATLQSFQDDLTRDCSEKHDPGYRFGKCAPMMPDLLLLPPISGGRTFAARLR